MAALIAYLYGQPDVVPNQAETVLEIAEMAGKFGEYTFSSRRAGLHDGHA
ncbi:hypothetical protein OG453_07230 [Streptomyces sp. NBC_01381]|nr:hypothetical protein [Streptomyces sp. NBC_01381]MCX4666460.1 hypothetical protein [Streptomyces sp. NBC_01381]